MSAQLYELCKLFYDYEKLLKKPDKNQKSICYLINLELIDDLKRQIYYDHLKPYIIKDLSFETLKNKINNLSTTIKANLKSEKFDNSQDLINALNNGNKYYFITYFPLFKKIRKDDQSKGIILEFFENKMIMIFNENDKLYFFDDKSGLIKKSLLIKNDITHNNEIKIPSIYIFKADIEILIRLYYYNKYLKERENSKFVGLNKENFSFVYLINNKWIETYKSFYEYDQLINYIIKKNKVPENNDDFLSEQDIDIFISNLPNSYIQKLEKKNRFDKNLECNEFKTNKLIGTNKGNKIEIKYLINSQIISSKIYDALIEEGYEKLFVKKCKLSFIGNNKILLFFNKKEEQNNDEIGYINEKNIFIPEYILDYKNKDIDKSDLENFFIHEFNNSFNSTENKNYCRIYDKNKCLGKCYRIDNKSNENIYDNSKEFNNSSNNIDKKNTIIAQINYKQKDLQKYIELLVQIYIFYENIKKKINQSLINSQRENYYIIREKWMNKFSIIFGYPNFVDYLRKKNINELTNDIDSEIIKLLPNEYIDSLRAKIVEENKLEKLKDKELYSMKFKNKNLNNKNIYYYSSDFKIINVEIFNLMKDLFKFEYEEKRDFLIGDNKLIMCLDLPYQYSLIIYKFNDFSLNCDVLYELDNKNFFEQFYNIIITKGYEKIHKNINFGEKLFTPIHANSKQIGNAYNLHSPDKTFLSTETQKKLCFSQNDFSPINNEKSSDDSSIRDSKNKLKEDPNTSTNKDIIKSNLNDFMKNNIKALILYYYFIEDLKTKINLSKEKKSQTIYNNEVCFLVDETWMNDYLNYFFYQELLNQIKENKEINAMNKVKQYLEIILANLDIGYINLLKNKEGKSKNAILKPIKEFENIFKEDKDRNILKSSFKYNIVSHYFFEYNGNRSDVISKELKQKEYLINDGKLIIKLNPDSTKRYNLLVGTFNMENNRFIPELLLEYYSEELKI